MGTEARTVAARLGIDETVVRRLQARGHLLTLPTDAEIRRRLYRAHLRFAVAGESRRRSRPRSAAGPLGRL
jgi:hypothetical protein